MLVAAACVELLPEGIEAAEVPLDGFEQLTLRFATALRRKVLPEQAVQHVP